MLFTGVNVAANQEGWTRIIRTAYQRGQWYRSSEIDTQVAEQGAKMRKAVKTNGLESIAAETWEKRRSEDKERTGGPQTGSAVG